MGYVLRILLRGVSLFGGGRGVSRAPPLCAPVSSDALGLMGALDMGAPHPGRFRDDPKDWGHLMRR